MSLQQGYAISDGNWWRFWHTINPETADKDFTFNQKEFQVYRTRQPNTVPIYTFSSAKGDLKHNTLQTSADNEELGPNFTNDGVMCYAFSGENDAPGLIPIYRFWSETSFFDDIPGRRYVISPNKEQGAGWEFDKIVFYAFPSAE